MVRGEGLGVFFGLLDILVMLRDDEDWLLTLPWGVMLGLEEQLEFNNTIQGKQNR